MHRANPFGQPHGFVGPLTLIGMAIAAWPAFAQDAAPAGKPAAEEERLEKVVVTAQKRLQQAQDVPVSLFSMAGGQLERSGIGNVQDLGGAVAGVAIGAPNPGNLRINIRGVTDLNSLVAGTPANGFYIDEMPISATGGLQPDVGLWDAQRVEILRGPQGTLFGEGSMGGTIRVISRKPDSSAFFGRVALGVAQTSGGGSGYEAKTSLNLPIQQDVLAMSVGAAKKKTPGWIDIPDLGKSNSNTTEEESGRVAVRLTPSKELSIDLTHLVSRLDGGEFGATSPGVQNPRELIPTAGKVGFPSVRNVDIDATGLTIHYDLGDMTLVSATSALKSRIARDQELDSIAPLFFRMPGFASVRNADSIDTVTQELRLVSNGDNPLDWTVGAYYKTDKRDRKQNWYFKLPLVGLTENSENGDSSTATSKALFGDVDYELAPQWSVQAGVRFYKEDKTNTGYQTNPSAVFRRPPMLVKSDFHANATSPKLVLNWKADPNVLVFAKVSKGFRGGGANATAAAVSSSMYPEMTLDYKPETVTSYEVGTKTSPAPGWFFNAYAYTNKWQDLQLGFQTRDGLYGYTSNASSATAKGVELELGGRVMKGLNLGMNLSYVDSTIDSTVLDGAGRVNAQAGSEIPLSPKFKLALTADYAFPVTEAIKGNVNLRYAQASATHSSPTNLAMLKNGATKQLYLRVGLSDSHWGSLSLYGDNLLNRADSVFKAPVVNTIPLVYTTYVRPRTVGLEYQTTF